jgi:hypothetical protein
VSSMSSAEAGLARASLLCVGIMCVGTCRRPPTGRLLSITGRLSAAGGVGGSILLEGSGLCALEPPCGG